MNACVQLPAGDEFRSGAKFFYHLIRESETRSRFMGARFVAVLAFHDAMCPNTA